MTDRDRNIVEEYKMNNTEENWNSFMEKYPKDAEIAVESSTTGKYVAMLLRDNGFRIHLANPKALRVIFSSTKKTERMIQEILQNSCGWINFLNPIFPQRR